MSADYLALAIAPALIRAGASCDARVRFDLAAGRERLSMAGLVPGRNGGVDMNASLQAVLTDAERLLVTETEPAVSHRSMRTRQSISMPASVGHGTST